MEKINTAPAPPAPKRSIKSSKIPPLQNLLHISNSVIQRPKRYQILNYEYSCFSEPILNNRHCNVQLLVYF